ncbi:uncharacterized protein LOC130722393 [Lotus japonicus]|uniref:uncharacterized protein LOC130722393 n=1 Tax=Lotus japonicus TaxID=34305 RepID=UPI0025849B12|nr:uncharacterized protein LOC130722393 [Lotus japonicus]
MTLRDIMRQEDESNMNKPFDSKVVILCGDFRQILPTIPKGGRQDIVSVAVNSSDPWKLTRNMRLGMTSENPLLDFIDFTFPNLFQNKKNDKFLEERCILCPTLESVEKVNDFILELLPGNTMDYLSSDSTFKSYEDRVLNFSCFGIPNQQITLKKCGPLMLLRNIDQATGLCNGK